MLDALTIMLMLLAGLLHASWHSLVKYGDDGILILAGMGLVAATGAACALPLLPFPSLTIWPVIGGSVVLHVGYKFALARSYTFGDLGQVYPMARGFVPLFSTAIAFLVLSQTPTPVQAIGIALVSAGLLWLAMHSIRGGVDRRLFVAALMTGLTVAGYSVVDAYGTRLSGHWASFTAWLIVCDAFTFALLIHAMKGRRLWSDVWRYRTRTFVSGSLGLLSFSVFLWALSRNPVGAVSALREGSVLFAIIIGIAVFKEKASPYKLAATGLIVLGLIVIAAGH